MSLVPFSTLPDSSRIWIFAADRRLTDQDAAELGTSLKGYLESWKAHGAPVQASSELRYNQFLIIAANPDVTAPSGCSIDNMTHAISDLGEKFGIDFFGQMNVFYKEGEAIKVVGRGEFKRLAKEGIVNAETMVFDNSITTLAELQHNWLQLAANSWQAALLPALAA